MPKNENDKDHRMKMESKMGIVHLRKKPEFEDNNEGRNLNFDVHICQF